MTDPAGLYQATGTALAETAVGAGTGLATATVLASPGARLVEVIELLISCGAEMDPLRIAAERTLMRFDQFLQFDRRAPYALRQWSYHLDPGRDEPAGHLPDRSLQAVNDSEGVIGIVGDTVPTTTRLEIRRVYELRDLGQVRHLWFFRLQPARAPRRRGRARGAMDLADFISELRADFGVDRVYHTVVDEADFVGSLIFELLPFVVARTGSAFGPLTGQVGGVALP